MFKSRKKKIEEILQEYNNPKTSNFYFERIASYFSHINNIDSLQVISDSTCQDLDFEELFMSVDRTSSAIGQQYLYSRLRTIPKADSNTFEKLIDHLNQNPKAKKSAILALNKLNNPGAYYIQQLIFGDEISKPKWLWILPILSNLSIITMILSFIYPFMALVLIPILAINIIIHLWNKSNVLSYSNTIPQLLTLRQITASFLGLGLILEKREQIKTSEKVLRKIFRRAIFFKWESKISDDIGQVAEYMMDLAKGAFLLEPILLFKLLDQIKAHKSAIHELFIAVSHVDVALSISSFRQSLPYYSIPTFTTKTKYLHADEIYHPLIVDAIPNKLDLNKRKSVLISGSNMSGKTTFIRTVGINVILAQTINTACCKKIVLPRLKVHTAIKISDNLLDETSYYYAEVRRIKELLKESESEHANLFLLDELFKGTNTIERIASGKAVLSYLNQKDNVVLASTHDLELTDYLNDTYEYCYFSDAIEGNLLTFDYKLKDGKLNHTNAIRILEINNFPTTLTDEAKTIAQELAEKKRKLS